MQKIEISDKSNLWKWISLISITAILIGIILFMFKIWYESKFMISPLLPKYLAIYTNRGGVNVMSFLLGGLMPSIFLKTRRKYLASTICIFIFFVFGLILKDSIYIYEYFYGLSQYLG